MKKLIGVALVVIVFAGYKFWSYQQIPEIPLGKTTLKTADGRILDPSGITGKYLLISCFQSWCGDCIREAPSVQALRNSMGARKLDVLMVSDEDWEKINRFGKLSKTDLSLLRSQTSFSELGVRVYPTTWLLSPDHKVLMVKREGFDWNSPEVHALIR
jgi:thiol-disulfide isomerase/thioredoxin